MKQVYNGVDSYCVPQQVIIQIELWWHKKKSTKPKSVSWTKEMRGEKSLLLENAGSVLHFVQI